MGIDDTGNPDGKEPDLDAQRRPEPADKTNEVPPVTAKHDTDVHQYASGDPLPPQAQRDEPAAITRQQFFTELQQGARRIADAEIVPALGKIVEQSGRGQLVGLDHYVKSLASLEEKYQRVTNAAERDGHLPVPLGDYVEDLRDCVRFTAQFPAEQFTHSVLATLDDLGKNGFTAYDGREIDTASKVSLDHLANDYFAAGNRYQGINTSLSSPSGQVFELQFHTPESYEVKTQTHEPYYEVIRSPQSNETERLAAVQNFHAVSSRLDEIIPTGADAIGSSRDMGYGTYLAENLETLLNEFRGNGWTWPPATDFEIVWRAFADREDRTPRPAEFLDLWREFLRSEQRGL